MAASEDVCLCADVSAESADANGAYGDCPRCDGRVAAICDHMHSSAACDVFHYSLYCDTSEKETAKIKNNAVRQIMANRFLLKES